MQAVFRQKRRKTRRSTIVAISLAIILVLTFTLPAIAQDRDILIRTATNINNVEAWWDALWEDTFNPPPITAETEELSEDYSMLDNNNLSLYAFVNPVRFLLAIGLIFWLFEFGFKMVDSRGTAQGTQVFLKAFFPVFVAMMFLANQAVYSRLLAYGLRDLANNWSEGVLELTITEYNIRGAIQDQLITEDAKEEIARKWRTCDAMPQPEVTIPSINRPGRPNRLNSSLPPEAANPPLGRDTDPNAPLPPPPPTFYNFGEDSGDYERVYVEGGEVINPEEGVEYVYTAPTELTLEQNQVYDYLECLQELSAYANYQLYLAEEERQCAGFICRTLKHFYKVITRETTYAYTDALSEKLDKTVVEETRTQEEIERLRQEADDRAENFGMDGEEILFNLLNPSKPLLYFSQWMWTSFLELALYLLALFAPMFIAISIIPGKQNMFNFWLIEFMTIALAKLAYIVVISVVAAQLSSPSNIELVLDNIFFMSLGIFAPGVSFAVVTAGAIAAAGSFKSQSVGTAAVVGSALSGAAASISYSMARNFDKNR